VDGEREAVKDALAYRSAFRSSSKIYVILCCVAVKFQFERRGQGVTVVGGCWDRSSGKAGDRSGSEREGG
jgi:hypothetical protein